MTSIKSILLYDLEALHLRLFNIIKAEALTLMPAIILIAAIFSFFFFMDFTGIIKRAALALMAIMIFNSIFTGSAKLGFIVSDSIISSDNHILKTWSEATSVRKKGFSFRSRKKADGDRFSISKIKNESFFESIGEDFFGFFIWILSNFALWFVKITFTLAYYLPLISIPIVAVVNILPFTNRALEGSLFMSVWIGITPIVISIILELLNAMIVSDMIMSEASFISRALMALLFSFYLVSSFSLSKSLIGATGISEGVSKMASSYATGMVAGVSSAVIARTRKTGMGLVFGKEGKHSPLRKMSVDPVNAKREETFKHAMNIDNDSAQTASSIVKGESASVNSTQAKVLKLNKLLNPIKAHNYSKEKLSTAKEAVADGQPDKKIDLNAVNKKRIFEGKGKISRAGTKLNPNNPNNKKDSYKNFPKKGVYRHSESFWNSIDEDYKNNMKRKYNMGNTSKFVEGKDYFSGRVDLHKNYFESIKN